MHRECSIITYNLFHDLPRFRHLERRLELVADAIAAAKPDLVALQEVAKAAGCGDMAAKLLALVNQRARPAVYTTHYARADGFGDGDYAFEEGVAILTGLSHMASPAEVYKYQHQVRLVTSVGGQSYRLPDDRIAIRMRFKISDDREIDFFVTHLTDCTEQGGGGETVRLGQALELRRWIDATSSPDVATIVAGDFNALPESEPVLAFTRIGFIDIWAAAGNVGGYTNDSEDIDLESCAASHNQRVDYLFCRPPRGQELILSEVRLFLDNAHREPDGRYLWPSDHIGVMARLRL
jgi:endonuclease/exonuclease/phosphatase family metal-dependent hydrolase